MSTTTTIIAGAAAAAIKEKKKTKRRSKQVNQNAHERLKYGRFLFGLDKTMVTFSAYAFDRSTKRQTLI